MQLQEVFIIYYLSVKHFEHLYVSWSFMFFILRCFGDFFAREVTVILPAREFLDFPVSERHVDWWNLQEIHEDLNKVIVAVLELSSQLAETWAAAD